MAAASCTSATSTTRSARRVHARSVAVGQTMLYLEDRGVRVRSRACERVHSYAAAGPGTGARAERRTTDVSWRTRCAKCTGAAVVARRAHAYDIGAGVIHPDRNHRRSACRPGPPACERRALRGDPRPKRRWRHGLAKSWPLLICGIEQYARHRCSGSRVDHREWIEAWPHDRHQRRPWRCRRRVPSPRLERR